MKRCLLALILIVCALASRSTNAASDGRPNFLVILTDDLGYSDIGCYGSEIETPTLDRLAAGGLRFSQFYNTAKCHSTRVSLMSGRWCRQAGDTSLRRAVTVAETLREAGYFTLMTGKWHLKQQPTDFGFDRYFGHLSGACNYYRGDQTFRLNGEQWQVPDSGFYTTVANVDHAIDFLGEARESDKPWFLYVAFNAPHAPLQPLKEDYERYEGKYAEGWDATREKRLAQQSKMGLLGADYTPSPRPENIPGWNDLSPEMKDWESRRMSAIAAIIDRVDQEVGRLVADLERNGELDNTLIMFFSDNGACPYDRRSTGIDDVPYNPSVSWSDSTGWAWARNSPFRYYKQNQFEGGVSTPGIMHWPAGLKTKPGAVVHSPAHIVDVLPTLADLGDAEVPMQWPDREPTPLAGVSLKPIFQGKTVTKRPPIHFMFSTDRALRDGDWKLVSFRKQPWELYNMADDRTELDNVAEQHPEITKRMSEQWRDMTKDVLMGSASDYSPVAEEATGHTHPEWTVFTYPSASGERKKGKGKVKASSDTRRPRGKGVRARKNTSMKVEDGVMVLTCVGEDPGLAFDAFPEMEDRGPYTLTFRLQSEAGGGGEIFWTLDDKTTLPNGENLQFDVTHDGQWRDISLAIPNKGRLFALRLDVCDGPGEARIEGLTLKDAKGAVVKSWP